MKKQKLVIGILLFVSFLIFVKQSDKAFHWLKSDEIRKPVVFSDGTGYYAYLPQVFIYQDKGFNFIDSLTKTYPNYTFNHCLSRTDEFNYYDKYFIGTALCMSPFFLTAHGITKITGGKLDGYSYFYQLFIALSTFCFWFIGCFFLFKTLRLFDISVLVSVVSLALITFVTNLNYYIVYEPSLSHIYSFAVISLWIFYVKKYVQTKYRTFFIWSCALLGLVILIRPVNGIVLVLFPFFFSTFSNFKNWFVHFVKNEKSTLLVGVGIIIALMLVQYLNVYLQVGKLSFGAYDGETFEFLWSPKIFEVLFSYRKGLFVYTPFLALTILGFFPLFKRDRFLFLGMVIFTFLFTYITASWWCWYYGGSLGMRPYVDVYAVFVLLLAFLLSNLNRFTFVIFSLVSIVFFYYNGMLLYQYDHAIIHYSEMNEARFKKVFLKTDRRFEWETYVQEPKNHFPNWNKLGILSKQSFSLGENGEKRIGTWATDSVFSREAFVVKFKAKISEDASPYVSLYGIKDGVHQNLDGRMYGWSLIELNKYYTLEFYFPATKYLHKMDSVYFLFSGQAGVNSIKDLSIVKYREKKN
jgi:hypothetical protein